MNGVDYIATVRLSNKADETLAVMGEPCDRVPASSLPWLLEQGLIEPAPAVMPAESYQAPTEDEV